MPPEKGSDSGKDKKRQRILTGCGGNKLGEVIEEMVHHIPASF